MASRSRTRNGPEPSFAPVVITVGVAGACAAGWFGYPSVPVVWLAFLVAAWMEPSAPLTGPKDSYGYPTPAHPGEAARQRQERFFRDMRFRLLVPNGDWMPGWAPLAVWFSALLAATFGAAVPVVVGHQFLVALHGQRAEAVRITRAANALTAFVLVAQVAGSRRRTAEGGGCPGVRVDSLVSSWRTHPVKMVAGLLGGAVVGFGVDLAVRYTEVAYRGHLAATLTVIASPALTTIVTVGGGAWLGMCVPWSQEALARWRRVVAAGIEWAPRWRALKADPAPRAIDRTEIGPVILDTFDAPSTGAGAFWPMGVKLTPTVGAGRRIAVLEAPDEGPGGPMPGTRHPLRFSVASWPGDNPPLDVTDPSSDPRAVEIFAHSAMVWTLEPRGYGRPVPIGVSALHAPDSPVAVWASRWAWPDGPSLLEIRPFVPDLAEKFGCRVLIDERSDTVFFGAIGDDSVVWADPDTDWSDEFDCIATEDTWNSRWAATLKQGANPPVPQRATAAAYTIGDATGREVHRLAFLTRGGVDPGELRGLEPKLATALEGAPYVAICGWPGKGERAGERHPQAFVVYWSETPVPPLGRLGACPAARPILAGTLNAAFDSARLPRPELVTARCLTRAGASRSTWEVELRLHGGVTLADVRSKSGRLTQTLGVDWLRVTDGPGGATIYAGERPENAELADEDDRHRLVSLDWERAWADSGVVGAGGDLPSLVDVGSLPANRAVEAFDFTTPPGVSRQIVKAALSKLSDATGYGWLDLRDSPLGPGHYRLLASRDMPIPSRAPVDFDAIDAATGWQIPFATGVEGLPVAFDPSTTPHALIAGATGSGKSSVLQGLIYGLLSKGASLVVIDPTKGGADFAFAKPWALAFAATIPEASAVMRAVYAEVVRRKEVNAAAGVGSYRDLPDPPPPLVVLVDEFTSLVIPEQVKKTRVDDPTAAALIEETEDLNAARITIGSYVSRVAREARSAGVILLLATQKLTAKLMETVPGGQDLKDNLGRCLLGQTSSGLRMSALRSPEVAPELSGEIPPGRGLWEPLTSSAQLVQAWYTDQAGYTAALEARRPRLDPSERLDLTQWLPGASPQGTGRAPAVDQPDEVVDLGEISFSLDDLLGGGTDDTDTSEAGTDEPPETPAEPDPDDDDTREAEDPLDPWETPLDWGAPEPAQEDNDMDAAPAPASDTPTGDRVYVDIDDPADWDRI